MALKGLFLLPLFLLVLVPHSVFGVADIENKNIIAEFWRKSILEV